MPDPYTHCQDALKIARRDKERYRLALEKTTEAMLRLRAVVIESRGKTKRAENIWAHQFYLACKRGRT